MEVAYATKRIFILLLALISFITAVFLYMGHFHHTFVLDTVVSEKRSVAKTIYTNTFKNITEKYELIANNILMNDQIIDAFEKRDRTRLLKLTDPLYSELTRHNRYLKVMHFHTPDTHSFLRLHKPEKFGDDLSGFRHIINNVNTLRLKQIGLEVGRYGIYYRIALPVFNKTGEHLGVFEFGIDINYILNFFNEDYGFSSMLVLKKEVFDIMYETNKELSFTALNGEYNIIKPDSGAYCDCYSSDIITEPYIVEEHDNRSNLIFKVTDLTSIHDDEIGKVIFIKDLGFYLDTIAVIRTLTIAAAALLMLLTFYLLRRIFNRHISVINRYQNTLKQKNRTLERLTVTDHLTKVYSRRYCDSILRKELKNAQRHAEPLSVILLDVDNFKKVNDTYGHNIGDRVLTSVAALITDSVRETDEVGRWGGEEFIVILPRTPLQHAEKIAQKLCTLLAEYDFVEPQTVTGSFGVASHDTSQNVEALIHNADIALYEAKNLGKSQVIAFSKTREWSFTI